MNETLKYFEKTKPISFHHFRDFAYRHQLYDRSASFWKQDWTMMVGMIKDFFSEDNCGVTDESIKTCIDKRLR